MNYSCPEGKALMSREKWWKQIGLYTLEEKKLKKDTIPVFIYFMNYLMEQGFNFLCNFST